MARCAAYSWSYDLTHSPRPVSRHAARECEVGNACPRIEDDQGPAMTLARLPVQT